MDKNSWNTLMVISSRIMMTALTFNFSGHCKLIFRPIEDNDGTC